MRYLRTKTYSEGFTAIELLITVTILGVIVGMSAPSMREFSRNQMIVGAISDLASDIQYARAEAVARKTSVEVCPSSDGVNCANSDNWINGWIVQITDTSRCPATDDCILKSRDTLNSMLTLNASTNNSIAFDEQGTTSSNVTFALCAAEEPASIDNVYLRTLSVKTSGSKHIRTGASTCNP